MKKNIISMKKNIISFFLLIFAFASACAAVNDENYTPYDFTEYIYKSTWEFEYETSEYFGNNKTKIAVLIKSFDELQILITEEQKLSDEMNIKYPLIGTQPFMEKLRSYGEDFFENGMLVLVHCAAGSGSYDYQASRLYTSDGETVTFEIKNSSLPLPTNVGVTCDMAYFTFIAECEKTDANAATYIITDKNGKLLY